jgi:vacuolar-type H+-ATPase subunit C/Vma6
MIWSDLDARARGLATRLIGAGKLRQWVSASDLAPLTMVILGAPPEDVSPTPGVPSWSVLDRGMADLVSSRLSLLRQWAGARSRMLDALFEEDERRTIRALGRGAVIGVPSSARLDGLVPSVRLHSAALQRLAEASSVVRLADGLVEYEHPYGPPLLTEARRTGAHLLTLEHCLDRVYTERVSTSARRGDRAMIDYARFVVDAQNCWWAVSLAGVPSQERPTPAQWFLPGGRRLTRSAYERALGTSSRAAAGAVLARLFPRSRLGSALATGEPADILEDAAVATALAFARSTARSDPLGSGPIISYVLRQRAELRDVRRLLWARALATPPDRVRAALVSS